MQTLAVLMTCHDRREKTVASIRAVCRSLQDVPGLRGEVFLTDDGSTDGTSEAVEALGLPVTIARGGGDLFWNRGTVRAWRTAIAAETDHDAYLLLNDDTLVDADAAGRLVEVARRCGGRAIVVGSVRDPLSGHRTYGGLRRPFRWHPGRTITVPIVDEVQDADTFNANCVLVPRAVYNAIGPLDETYTHAIGDIDYGYRAKEAGFRVLVAPGTVGTCERNEVAGSWLDADLPLRERLRRLESPKGLPTSEWRAFLRRHGAPLASFLALAPKVRVVVSSLRSGLGVPGPGRPRRRSG